MVAVGVAVGAVSFLCGDLAAHADVQSTHWLNAALGQWSDSSRWSNGMVPNNGNPAGTTYAADIGATGQAYAIWDFHDTTVDQLTLNSSSATSVLNTPLVFDAGAIYLQQGTLTSSGGATIRRPSFTSRPGHR